MAHQVCLFLSLHDPRGACFNSGAKHAQHTAREAARRRRFPARVPSTKRGRPRRFFARKRVPESFHLRSDSRNAVITPPPPRKEVIISTCLRRLGGRRRYNGSGRRKTHHVFPCVWFTPPGARNVAAICGFSTRVNLCRHTHTHTQSCVNRLVLPGQKALLGCAALHKA